MTQASSFRSSRQGFTLVEVLVSSFLTLVVMGMLFSVLIGTLDAWESGTSRLESSGDARLALDILKSDLESLVARQTQYNQEWISSRPFQDPVSGVTNTWLSFFSPSLDRVENQQGDIVAVAYATSYQDPISVNDIAPIFGFYKAMTSTEYAFNEALDYPPEALLTEENGTPGFWRSAANPNVPDLSFTTNAQERKDFLAPHVVKFTVSWLVQYPGNAAPVRVDENHYIRLNNRLEIYPSSPGAPGAITDDGSNGGRLIAAEISLTTLSQEGANRYRLLTEAGNQAGQMDWIIQQYGRTHSLRVPIHY